MKTWKERSVRLCADAPRKAAGRGAADWLHALTIVSRAHVQTLWSCPDAAENLRPCGCAIAAVQKLVASMGRSSAHPRSPDSREQISIVVSRRKWPVRPEVVGFAADRAARDSDEEVRPPAEEKMEDQPLVGEDGKTQLVAEDAHQTGTHGEGASACIHCVGHVGLSVGHVVGVHVVNCMRSLPGKEWDQQRCMEEISDQSLEGFVIGKCTVSALVRDNPVSRRHSTGDN
jgi:hypothetical protein